MFIIAGTAISFIFSIVQLLTLSQKKSAGICSRTIVKNFFTINLFSLAILKYLFQYPHFLVTEGYGIWDLLLYCLICLVVGLVLFLIRAAAEKHCSAVREKKSSPASRITSVILVFLGLFCIFATNWAKAEYGDLPADQLLITYFSPTTGSSMVNYSDFIEGPLFSTLFLTTIFTVIALSKYTLISSIGASHATKTQKPIRRTVSLVLAVVIFFSGIGYGVYRFHISSLYHAYFAKSSLIDKNFVDPRQANLKFPEKKRNLIHIYLESMENSYMSKDLGGFMDENLIPELTALAAEGFSFSHLDHQFGGPQAAVGTTWSVASMVNMSTGLPMKAPTEPNAYGSENNFLPGAYTMGDILAEQGYEQTLMFGADSDFGGLTYYFKSHGDFKIMDHKYARQNGLIPPDYSVWWGYEDDKLFEFAKNELTRLNETGKPFHFVMETADTHRPDGYLSKYAPTPYENQYANVLSYNSKEVDKFVRWIQNQPFYPNTTVVIIGDHLSMETNFFEFYQFDKDYHRSQYNLILNPDPRVIPEHTDIFYNRIYGNFDMFPTILSSIGVEYDGHRLGIGTDLFSGEKTIFEEYGFDSANKELEKKSVFYNEQILLDPSAS